MNTGRVVVRSSALLGLAFFISNKCKADKPNTATKTNDHRAQQDDVKESSRKVPLITRAKEKTIPFQQSRTEEWYAEAEQTVGYKNPNNTKNTTAE